MDDVDAVVVLVDGGVQLKSVNSTLMLSAGEVSRTDSNSVQAVFENGLSIKIKQNYNLLTFQIQSPDNFGGIVEGLLGNADGDPTNDFVYQNGTVLSINSTDRERHDFGQSCKFSMTQCLVMYTSPSCDYMCSSHLYFSKCHMTFM